MQYLALALVVFALALVFALAGCRGPADAAAQPAPPAIAAPANPGSTSRAAIAKKLAALAASKPPTRLAEEAMCYKIAGPPARTDYVCPICGEKTIYAKEVSDRPGVGLSQLFLMEVRLPACRRLVAEIRDLGVRLDETEFCNKCQPDAKDPKLVLVVRFADDAREVRTRGVAEDDLRLLQEFLAGEAKHKGANDWETSLKDRLPRLQELLGVKLDEGK